MSASVYVHVPFCRGRCPYCDFDSNDLPDPPAERYLRALAREWEWRAASPSGGEAAGTVYVGGGTPSLLAAGWIAWLLRRLPLAPGAEVTVEANPGDADAGWYRALALAGATRFSIGAQAMDGERLRWLGRRHGVDDVARAVEAALASGAASVSADLIYGTPGHSPEAAAREARALVALGVDHVSAYELTIASRTPLGRRVAAADPGLPGEERLVAIWEAIGEALAELGFERYEISSHARPGRRCRHNEGYWSGGAYAGLGAGAHGHVVNGGRRLRYANTPNLEAYLDAALDGRFPESGGGVGEGAADDPVDAEGAASELVALGLRRADGIDLAALAALLGAPGAERIAAFARALGSEGSARREGDRLVPTARGMLLADGLAARF